MLHIFCCGCYKHLQRLPWKAVRASAIQLQWHFFPQHSPPACCLLCQQAGQNQKFGERFDSLIDCLNSTVSSLHIHLYAILHIYSVMRSSFTIRPKNIDNPVTSLRKVTASEALRAVLYRQKLQVQTESSEISSEILLTRNFISRES